MYMCLCCALYVLVVRCVMQFVHPHPPLSLLPRSARVQLKERTPYEYALELGHDGAIASMLKAAGGDLRASLALK
jgi:hypothetical protein